MVKFSKLVKKLKKKKLKISFAESCTGGLLAQSITSINGASKGDILVRVTIETPINISLEQKKLLEQLKESFDKDRNSPKEKSWFENAKDFMTGQ